jgi:type I restriction enzyme R subunit
LEPEDITARQFDLLLLNLQLAVLKKDAALPKLQATVRQIAGLLEEKQTIPVVSKQLVLIQWVQSDEFWEDVSLPMLENVRKKLRDLIKFIERGARKPVYTNFEDEMGEGAEIEIKGLVSSINAVQYRKKVLAFLNEHLEEPPILKLRFNEPLAPPDLTALESLLYQLDGSGTQAQFEDAFGPQPSLGTLIRTLVGLAPKAVQQAFASFLDGSTYTSNQIAFIRQIIDYLTHNGTMDPGKLYDQPFTDHHPYGLGGLFAPEDARSMIAIIQQINENAVV